MQDSEIFENLAELDLEKRVPIPYIIKNAVLISPGTWNNFYYTPEAIHEAFRQTDWNDKKIVSLFLDHLDDRTSEWAGYVKNPHMIGDKLLGDLEIFDPMIAIKMALGKPKFGVSPRVKGKADEGIMRRYIYENFSLVINPAVKTTYINNMEVKGMDFKLQEEDEELDEAGVSEPTEVELAKKKKEEPEEEMAKKKKEEEEDEKCAKKKKEDEYPEMAKKKKEDEEKEEMSAYTDFVKKYIKEHKGDKPAKELIKDAADAWKKKQTDIEMAEEENKFQGALEQILEYLKKKKGEEYPYKYPYKASARELVEFVENKDKEIQILNDRIEKLEIKLNEPDKIAVRTEGDITQVLTEYSDEAMLRYLKEEVSGSTVEVE